MKVDEPDVQVTNMGEGHMESLVGSSRTQPSVQNAETAKEPTDNSEEISAYTEYFKYISTMSSFEDSYFKETIKNKLMKDRKVTWKAFKKLSPASV